MATAITINMVFTGITIIAVASCKPPVDRSTGDLRLIRVNLRVNSKSLEKAVPVSFVALVLASLTYTFCHRSPLHRHAADFTSSVHVVHFAILVLF